MTNHPKAYWLKTTIITLSLVVSVDQEFGRGSAGWFWLEASLKAAVRQWLVGLCSRGLTQHLSLFMGSQDFSTWSLSISWFELPHIMVSSGQSSSIQSSLGLQHKCASKQGRGDLPFSGLALKVLEHK